MDNNENIDEYKKKLNVRLVVIDEKIKKNKYFINFFYFLIMLLILYGLYNAINGRPGFFGEDVYGLNAFEISIIFALFFTWPIYSISLIIAIVKLCSNNKLNVEKKDIFAFLNQFDNNNDTNDLEADNIENNCNNIFTDSVSKYIDEKIDYKKDNSKVEFVRCPKCKSKVLKGSKFCMKCGEHIK